MRPFVEIEGDRIGALHPLDERCEPRAQRGERTEGAIDMEPEMLAGRDIGDRGKIVDRPGVHRSGRADDEERQRAGRRSASIIAGSRSTRIA